jgi:DNA-binding MarR family transcriptional regulator
MSEPRWLDEREARAWRGFLRLGNEVRASSARQLQRETGLSEADYEVLVNLSEAPGGVLRAFELGRATKWEKSRLSHHLTRMAQRGLVERRRCPTDSRGSNVAITDAGRAAITEAAPRHVAHVRKVFVDVLTPEQLDALATIAETVIDGLEAAGDGCPTEAECEADDPCDDTCDEADDEA